MAHQHPIDISSGRESELSDESDEDNYSDNYSSEDESLVTGGGEDQHFTADDLRSNHKQEKYRELRNARSGQQASHYVSLSLAVTITRRGRDGFRVAGQPPGDEKECLKGFLNEFNNFKMVNQRTNKVIHVKIDRRLEDNAKGISRQELTNDQYERAKKQVKRLQNADKVREHGMAKSTYDAFRNFYNSLNIGGRAKLWSDNCGPKKFNKIERS